MEVHEIITPGHIIPRLQAEDKVGALRALAQHVVKRHPGLDVQHVLALLLERERLGSTGLGEGLAIPHCKSDELECMTGLFARSITGVDFDAADGKPVHIFFVLLVPGDGSGEYLKVLAKVSALCRNPGFRAAINEAPADADEVFLHRLLARGHG